MSSPFSLPGQRTVRLSGPSIETGRGLSGHQPRPEATEEPTKKCSSEQKKLLSPRKSQGTRALRVQTGDRGQVCVL